MNRIRTLTVREANQDDSLGLAELFRIVFHFQRGEARYHWKFLDNPDGPPVFAVAEDEGRLVGPSDAPAVIVSESGQWQLWHVWRESPSHAQSFRL